MNIYTYTRTHTDRKVDTDMDRKAHHMLAHIYLSVIVYTNVHMYTARNRGNGKRRGLALLARAAPDKSDVRAD